MSDRGRGEHRLQWSCGGSDRSGCASSITIACCRAQTQRFHNNGFKGSVYTSHTTPPYSLNTWHRFALRYRTTVGFEIFVDKTLVATQSVSGSLARTATSILSIGAVSEPNVENANADFAIVRMYARALSDAELDANWDADAASRFGKAPYPSAPPSPPTSPPPPASPTPKTFTVLDNFQGTWAAGKAECEARGLKMAQPFGAAENAAMFTAADAVLKTMAPACPGPPTNLCSGISQTSCCYRIWSPWIGLKMVAGSNTWLWDSGISYANGFKNWTVWNGQRGSPSSGTAGGYWGSGDSCAQVFISSWSYLYLGGWVNDPCTELRPVTCQWTTHQPLPPG